MRGAAGREGAAKCGCGIGRGAMAGRCGAGAGWNAGAAGRAIAGAAGRATAAGAAPRFGCCAEAPMLAAIKERPTKQAAKGSAKPTLSGRMVVGSLSSPAPHASITRERGKRSAHERRASIIAALQDRLVRTPRCIAAVTPANSPRELGRAHAPFAPSHAAVLELQGTGGTNGFRQRLFLARLVGLIFIQAME